VWLVATHLPLGQRPGLCFDLDSVATVFGIAMERVDLLWAQAEGVIQVGDRQGRSELGSALKGIGAG
jgi:hypothetical protein